MDKDIAVLDKDRQSDPRWQSLTFTEDEYGLIYTYDANGKQICGAKNRQGGPCKKHPVPGRNRCNLHGGKSPRGMQHPRSKHLRYSKDIIGRQLAQKYEEARTDPELLSLRDEIALSQARIGELLNSVEFGESLKAWQELRSAYDEFVLAHRAGNNAEASQQLSRIGQIITRGNNQHQTWEEIWDTSGHKRRLAETERKRMSNMQQMMTYEQAMNMLTFVVSIMRRRVYQQLDNNAAEELLATISSDLSRYMGQTKTPGPNTSPFDDIE